MLPSYPCPNKQAVEWVSMQCNYWLTATNRSADLPQTHLQPAKYWFTRRATWTAWHLFGTFPPALPTTCPNKLLPPLARSSTYWSPAMRWSDSQSRPLRQHLLVWSHRKHHQSGSCCHNPAHPAYNSICSAIWKPAIKCHNCKYQVIYSSLLPELTILPRALRRLPLTTHDSSKPTKTYHSPLLCLPLQSPLWSPSTPTHLLPFTVPTRPFWIQLAPLSPQKNPVLGLPLLLPVPPIRPLPPPHQWILLSWHTNKLMLLWRVHNWRSFGLCSHVAPFLTIVIVMICSRMLYRLSSRLFSMGWWPNHQMGTNKSWHWQWGTSSTTSRPIACIVCNLSMDFAWKTPVMVKLTQNKRTSTVLTRSKSSSLGLSSFKIIHHVCSFLPHTLNTSSSTRWHNSLTSSQVILKLAKWTIFSPLVAWLYWQHWMITQKGTLSLMIYRMTSGRGILCQSLDWSKRCRRTSHSETGCICISAIC